MSVVHLRFQVKEAVEPSRAALLERVLARADRRTRIADWRSGAFRLLLDPKESMPGLGAAALIAEGGARDAAWVYFATPVHSVAAMTHVRLAEQGILTLDPAEAQALAADFERAFAGSGMRLIAGGSGSLYLLLNRELLADTHDPQLALGRDIYDFMPAGANAPQLRGLMSEIEMWLFEHPVNQARAARAALPVTGLWLWGGGAALARKPALRGWVAGRDALFGAFASCTEFPQDGESGVVVLAQEPGTEAWRDAEARWLVPAVAQLREGRIGALELSAGERCFEVSARWALRIWRRPRPWWECFAA